MTTYIRRRSLGGSDVGAVLGIDEYRSPYDVWKAITDPTYDSEEDSEHTTRGKTMEAIIAVEWEKLAGCNTQYGHHTVDREFDFLHSTHDFAIISGERAERDGPGILEIKSHNSWMIRHLRERLVEAEGSGLAAETAINPSYYAQIQHYLGVTGWKWAVYATLDYDKWEVIHIPVERDDQYISEQRQRLVRWWRDHIESGIPPEDLPREARRQIRKEWAPAEKGSGEVTRNDPEWMNAINTLRMAQDGYDLAKYALEQAKDAVKTLMGSQEVIVSPGCRIVWRESTRYGWDIERLAQEHAIENIKQYRTATAHRNFQVTFK